MRVLEEFPEEGPLSRFLPAFFRANRQMGSSDRRNTSRLVYNYFRLGKALPSLPVEQRLFIAEFLCSTGENPFLEYFNPELNAKVDLSSEEKIGFLQQLYSEFKQTDIFPFCRHLSSGVEEKAFLNSFLIQPNLFIRVHPGHEEKVRNKLLKAGIAITELTRYTWELPNGTKLDQLFPPEENTGFEVQDWSSQQTGTFFHPGSHEYWWDCCAASGGKSLLLFHQEPTIKLLVSDIRDNILSNLDHRFRNAGLVRYQKKLLDLTKDPEPFLHGYEFDGIILDAPCTGSGTWGRTPELISQFRESRISSFQRLQRSIASQVVKYLKEGKPLIYITCSVFKEENEENIGFLQDNFSLQCEDQQIIKGYNKKADTMFAARLIKQKS